MRIRKNQNQLSDTERGAFVDAVKKAKSENFYENFVIQHRDVFLETESAAHDGPGFLPWHREFLLRFEDILQGVAGSQDVTLPYWDWTVDNSKDSALWKPDFMGGNGAGPKNRVMDGPFAYNPDSPDKGWELRTFYNDPSDPQGVDPFLRRYLWQTPVPVTPAEVNRVLKLTPYDKPPWHGEEDASGSFRPELERQIHDGVHGWVGPSMLSICSPNDPVFWLHHCNIDRLWAQWQSSNPGWPYPPTKTPGLWVGHGLDDPMMPSLETFLISPTPRCVLNHHALGYRYDDEVVTPVYSAISWKSHWRVYAIGNDEKVYERRYDEPTLGGWTEIGWPGVALGPVAAVALPDSRDPANRLIRVYAAQELDGGGHAIQEYAWNGDPAWTNSKTWLLPTEVTSLAAVSWQDEQNGSHVRVYLGYLGQNSGQEVPTIRQLCWDWDSAQRWTERDIIYNRTLLSAFGWKDDNGVLRIRVHVENEYGTIRVLISSDGQQYPYEEQLP